MPTQPPSVPLSSSCKVEAECCTITAKAIPIPRCFPLADTTDSVVWLWALTKLLWPLTLKASFTLSLQITHRIGKHVSLVKVLYVFYFIVTKGDCLALSISRFTAPHALINHCSLFQRTWRKDTRGCIGVWWHEYFCAGSIVEYSVHYENLLREPIHWLSQAALR